MTPTPQEAYELLKEYNNGEFHLKHGRIVGDVMRWFAVDQGFGDEADFWQTVGILHDLDFEKYPEQHCVKEEEIMRERGVDERIIHATTSHGFGLTGIAVQPEHQMEKILFAADELTGLIGAVAVMRPSKSVGDLEVKSVKKKFKDKSFAAGCSRDVIRQGAEMLGWELDELIGKTIEAMRASENVD
ncbi:hydrolase [Pyramidobacter sp. C12-8]|uniref:hydrolase n=1 Tax=Pyramidobacter sp. C12-8 TaxID=1943580 RepID=UPI00098F9CDA|nr:hydrolase [Pyramidobacter sp. C12-8]OON89688.1 hydrolase [Pyramidobacter sp. C12-8]